MSAISSYFNRGPSIETLLDAINYGKISSVSAAITAANINSFSKRSEYRGENPLGLAIRLFFYVDYPHENSENSAHIQSINDASKPQPAAPKRKFKGP